MKLTEEIIYKLSNQAKNRKLITWEYLQDVNNQNFQYIKWKFFNWESDDKVKLLNVWSWLFTAISQTLAYYVWNPTMNKFFPTKKLVEDYVSLWFACFWLERKNWTLEYTYLPADSYYKENWIDYIIRAFTYQKSLLSKKFYYLITSYEWWIIKNELFESYSWTMTTDLKQVPLDTIEDTKNLQEIIDTGLEKCFFLIKEDLLEENTTSEIDKVKSIVYSIDRKIVMFDTQFLQNMESFVLLKWINLPTALINLYNENKKLSFSDLWRYITTEQDWSIEFINNQNNLLDTAIEYEKRQTEKISSLTSIPLDFLWWTGTAGAIWEGSRQLLHWAFIKKIKSIRDLFDITITESLWVISKEENSDVLMYSWSDVFSKSSTDLIDELSVALENWLISKKTALQKYLDYSDEEVDNEFLQIQNENLQLTNNTNAS